MNKLTDWDNSLRCGRLAVVLLAVIFSIQALPAQPTEQTVRSRFLFIFDTSNNMKPRFEAVEKSLNIVLATSLGGQMHAGDSMGVWTFNQSLQTKGFPLQNWNPDAAVAIASNLVKFVRKQSYAKSTYFEALQPTLNRVMQGSERLTVLIFCDGESKISGTPYDDAINQALQEKLAEQKKARQPFVIVLRSQLGQYVACTVSLPPQLVNVPEFPPLPLPPPPPMAKKNITPPVPVVVAQPLIIIGKKPPASMPPPVTNAPPAAVPENPAAPAPETAPAVQTNTAVTATNPVVANLIEMTPTNPPPPMSQSPVSGGQNYRLIGAGLLGAAVALGLVLGLRPRRKETSLISRSLKELK